MRHYSVCCAVLLFLATGYAQKAPTSEGRMPRPVPRGAYAVDAGGRQIHALETGSSLFVQARGMHPRTMYEFRVGVGREAMPAREGAVSFARVTTNARGDVPPFLLWYESGVAGCSDQESERRRRPPNTYRTLDEAERALAGKTLLVSVHAVQRDESGRTAPMKLAVEEKPESAFRLPVVARKSPAVYASDARGCMVNSQLVRKTDLYASGQHFRPGEILEISVVPNQRLWYVGDRINDITGAAEAAATKRIKVDARGRFTVKAWAAANQQRGAYDIVAHRPGTARRGYLGANDIVSYAAETGLILYLLYPPGGTLMDIAGRPIGGSPYFEFADSFAPAADPVWAAVDPTYVPANHPGGTYASYYVVKHRDVAGWDPGMGGSTDLVDVSGGPEIHPVKSWCVNGTDIIVWQPSLDPGNYDVVVDFGQNPAATPQQYVTDLHYDAGVDFLDGATQVGFVVAPDPYDLGPTPIGQDSYSQDGFFPTLGTASNVDLRAVVRYPATAAGVGTAMAPGKHPIFVIEHGNHFHCAIGKDGRTTAQEFADYLSGTVTWQQFAAWQYDHATCPNRTKNHEGYMHLLDALASNGIIAVSVDAYTLTGLGVPGWIQERGTLILKHLELWSHMNDPQTFTSYPDFFNARFANHVDMSKISVSGHSRGGEASVASYMLNTSFSIGSVSSIAPVDFLGYVLPDVPYFVILPAADGDVYDLNGVDIYDRAGRTLQPPDATLKTGIDVYGASHNFFNTVWAADFDDGASNRPDFIPAASQQKIGEAYLAAYARIHLNNETVYLDMMRGKLSFPSIAGRKIYPFHHEKTHAKLEDGTNLGAVGGGGATVVSQTNPSVHQTDALRIGWPANNATLTYSIPAAKHDTSGFEVLSFRVAQTNSNTNPVNGDQDFQVELQGGGKSKGTFATYYGHIPRPYDQRGQNVMTTIRIPLHSFILNNSGVTLNDIDTLVIRFLYPTQGEIYVDDIEFSR